MKYLNVRYLATATALVMLLAVSGLAAAAEQTKPKVPPGPPPGYIPPEDVRAEMLAQQPFVEAASEIRWAVERGDGSGFTDIALSDGAVEVSWKGELPDAIAEVIAKARETVPVRLNATPYSLAELTAAGHGLVEQLDPAGPVHSVKIPADWSGLTVAVDPDADEVSLPAAPVPVDVVKEPRIQPVSGRRLTDWAPFWGGARFFNSGNRAECTTGFGTKDGNGTEWLLTAGHCGKPGDTVLNGNQTRYVGTMSYEKPDYDLMLIHSDAGGRIYVNDGPFTPFDRVYPPLPGASEFDVPVAGWDWTFDGELVCHSGSVSGTICGLRNTAGVRVSGSFFDPDCSCWQWVNDQELATRVDGGLPAMPGDSGGPVFTLYFSSRAWAWRAVAKGIVVAAAGPMGAPPTDLVYQDFGTAWQHWGLNPIWEP
jgi:streptogrisin D